MDIVVFLVAMALVLYLGVFRSPFRKRPAVPIVSPRLGLWNPHGGENEALVEEDKAMLAPLFSSVEVTQYNAPVCDVLFAYCKLTGAGELRHSRLSFAEQVKTSQAVVVVIASENDFERGMAAAESLKPSRLNLIVTADRRGAIFSRFFVRLFTRMHGGVGMPVAWNELAPQTPHETHAQVPSTICLIGAGQTAFKKR